MPQHTIKHMVYILKDRKAVSRESVTTKKKKEKLRESTITQPKKHADG